MKTTLKDMFRHWLNPLHIYCRLDGLFAPLGISRKTVQRISKIYEKAIYHHIL